MASAPAPTIRQLDTATLNRICGGQVVIDLSGAVKELVENALDAGATSVEVRLREFGSELLEVSDNGRGIPASEHAGVTRKSWT
jgi:DNA mismatch repair protein PMS2